MPGMCGRFIARKGNVVTWHFAHFHGIACGGEGSRHAIAKHMIAAALSKPLLIRLPCSHKLLTEPYKVVKFADVRTEDTFRGYRVDVTCKRKAHIICIEVIDRNPTERQKSAALADVMVEIPIEDLSDAAIVEGKGLRVRLLNQFGAHLLQRFTPQTGRFFHTWSGPCWQCGRERGIAVLCEDSRGNATSQARLPTGLLAEMRRHAEVQHTAGGYINVCPYCGSVQAPWQVSQELTQIVSSLHSEKVKTIFWRNT